MFKERFKKTQINAYTTLYNSFLNNHLSHAYLLSGDSKGLLKETAIFLAKSFLCEEDVLACESCKTCKRIDNKTYVDFKFINEDETSILKDDIETLIDDFSITAMEKKGIKVYIIHLIENANAVAVNKLLKFLEEPADNIKAILTTSNLSKVLPTIISRCQLIRLNGISKNDLKEILIKDGFDEVDAKILSSFYISKEEVKKDLETLDYNAIKDTSFDSFEILLNKKEDLIYYVQRNVIEKYKTKKEIKLFLEILICYIIDLLLDKSNNICPKSFNNDNNLNLEEILTILLIGSGQIDLMYNQNLLIDNIFYKIVNLKGE